MRAAAAALMLALAAATSAAAADVAAPPAPAAVRVVGWPAGQQPQAPPNFRVFVFARGLDGPRAMLVLPNGDVAVAESRGPAEAGRKSANRVTLLRDSSGAGIADQQFALLNDLERPSGLALRRDRLLVAVEDAVLGCPFLVGQLRMHGDCHAILALPTAGRHQHWSHSLALDPDETHLFVAVGSSGDAAPDDDDASEPKRAALIALAMDGRGQRVYASGLRDVGGLAIEPLRSRLFAVVGAHGSGAEGLPDFLTRVDDGGFYGFGTAPARKGHAARAQSPEVLLGTGLEPRGLLFYTREQMPKGMRRGAFIALAGPVDQFGPQAYKVVHLPFADGRPTGPPQDFLTGFVKDAAAAEVYARPLALAVATDGALLVADDSGTIWRVVFKCASCTPDPVPARPHEKRPNG